MGFFSFLFPWGVLLQALALVHFLRRRPDTIWLWIIIFLGPVGALIYLFMEVAPDLGLLRQSFDAFGRRKRIGQLEAIVLDNPSVGNYEELADLYLDEGMFARARECYDKAISPRHDQPDPVYRRGIAEIHLGDFASAARDLESVTSPDAKYDFHRAIALLAHACANTGQPEGPKRSFSRQRRFPRCRKPTSTTRRSSCRNNGLPRRASGPSASWPRSRRCRGTCSGASAPGSAGPVRC